MARGFFSVDTLGAATPKQPTLIPQCEACKLYQKCKSPKMPVDGEGRKGIMIIGEAPGETEDHLNKPFVGKSGRYLQSAMMGSGVDLRRDCWILNALACRPPNNQIGNPKRIDFCRPNVIKAIRQYKPHTILLLGTSAIKSVIGWLWKEDVGILQRWIGWQIPCQELNAWLCPLYHPSYLLRKEEEFSHDRVTRRLFLQQLHAALELDQRPWKKIPDYSTKLRLYESSTEAAAAIKALASDSATISFDYETNRLKPDSSSARIVCCAVSNGQRTISYPWTTETATATKGLLESDIPKYGWNAKFEERWTRKILDCEVKNWQFDGMLGSHVLDNRSQTTGLKFQAFVRLGVGPYDALLKPYLKGATGNAPNRIHEAPRLKLLEYCAMDALLEHKLCTMLRRELKDACNDR